MENAMHPIAFYSVVQIITPHNLAHTKPFSCHRPPKEIRLANCLSTDCAAYYTMPHRYRIFIHSLVPSPRFSPFWAHHRLTFV